MGEPGLDPGALLVVCDVELDARLEASSAPAGGSSSRMSARERTISASAQNATPSP